MFRNEQISLSLRDNVKNFLEQIYGQEIDTPEHLRFYGKRVLAFVDDTGMKTVFWRFRRNYKHDQFTLRDAHKDPLQREIELIARGAPIDLMFYCEVNDDAVSFNRWQIIDLRMVREILNFRPELVPAEQFNFGDDSSFRTFHHTLHPLMLLCCSDMFQTEEAVRVRLLPRANWEGNHA